MATQTVEDKVCESCIEAFEEEGMPRDGILDVLWLGRDIPDHICEAREEETIRCACPCSPYGKTKYVPKTNEPVDVDPYIRDYLCITNYQNGNDVAVLQGKKNTEGDFLVCLRIDGRLKGPTVRFYADGSIESGTISYSTSGAMEVICLNLLKGPGKTYNWRYFHESADPVIHENEYRNMSGEKCPACVYARLT